MQHFYENNLLENSNKLLNGSAPLRGLRTNIPLNSKITLLSQRYSIGISVKTNSKYYTNQNTTTKSFNNNVWSYLMLFLIALALCPFQLKAQTYSGPIVITKGGTYTGNWESNDSEVSAVEIKTSEPLIILNSNIRGAGYLIKSWYNSANLVVRNTSGYGLPPTPYQNYKKPRRFVTVNNFKNLVIENCYLEQTAGIYAGTMYEGNGTPNETIKIRYNIAKNIDSRVYGGNEDHSQFVQFNFRGNLPNAEIAWNQIINSPDLSRVEDNISIHNSKGTASSPIKIHDNYIQGAYPIPSTSISYSGGGILSDGDGDASSCTAFVEAYNNQLVNLGNYSMGIASGNNIHYHNNRAVNSATFEDGSRFKMYTSGFWSKDYYNPSCVVEIL
ncbi:glycosyl hydrolase [Pontibacter sp. E15-1]|uniref:glycosyl hydrolase n=1 Tax=Pontibacter sp. E15-1 TaxID=2919918 RepID=UPI001F4FC9A3|nr:glycosyl hydrolase [Pontibacter sp. E15-1]MCJ8163499.1 glycosyl hydrolase [Pontibacter sp. E15-1]